MRNLTNDARTGALLVILLALPLVVAADPPKPDGNAKGFRGGASGQGRGNQGGDGGNGGDGGWIEYPKVSPEQLQATERSLTSEQKKMLDEYAELHVKLSARRWSRQKPKNAANYRNFELVCLAIKTPMEQQKYWKELSESLLYFHKQLDPFYVTAKEKAAAAQLPATVASEVDRLLSEDAEAYLAARHDLLSRGPACKALIAERAKGLKADDERLRLRLAEVVDRLSYQETETAWLRTIDAALKRAAELRQARTGKQIAVLLARYIRDRDDIRRNDPYFNWCYFSFQMEKNGYDGAVSLEFGNGYGEWFYVRMYGGQQNRIKDLGAVHFEAIRKAPNAKTTATWEGEARIPAIVGHVYVEHCLDPREGVDQIVKFQVLDLKPGGWVVIEWEPLAREK